MAPALSVASRTSSATLTQRSGVGAQKEPEAVVRVGSVGSGVSVHGGLRDNKEELVRSDSAATQVLDGADGDWKELKYAPAPVALDVHPALQRRTWTYARLPRPLWPHWREYVGAICTEYERARVADNMDATMEAMEKLLNAPGVMLGRAGGVDMVRERYRRWKQKDDDEGEAKADEKGAEEDQMNPMQMGEAERRGGRCFDVPPGLLQKTSDPAARRVQNILRTGAPKAMRKAATAAMQDGLAEQTEAAYEALRPLHPKRDQMVNLPIPEPSARVPAVINGSEMASIVNGYRGAAAGPSNWTADLLMPLLDNNEIRHVFAAIVTDIAVGRFDGSIVGVRLRACALVGLVKDDVTKKLRPVAMGELFLKVAVACVMAKEKDNIASIFKTIQFGIGRNGGSESASIVANAALNGGKRIGMALLDQGNAFNQIPRALILRQLYARQELRSLHAIADFAYGTPSPLLMYNRSGELVSRNIYSSEQGVRQGCALGGLLYANAVQELYAEALAAAGDAAVTVLAVMDDVAVIGEIGGVRRVVKAFKEGSAKRGLELNIDKCVVLQPEDVGLAAEWQEYAAENGFQKPLVGAAQWLGTAVGWDAQAMIRIIAEANKDQHDKLFRVLHGAELGAQNALLLLRSSILPRATYAMRTACPPHVDSFTRKFDSEVLRAMASIVERKMPSDGSSVFGPSGESFRLSLKRGGVGLCSANQLSAAAYVSAVAVAISYMTKEQRDTLKRNDNMTCRGLMVAVTKLIWATPQILFAPTADPKHPFSARECKSTAQFVDHYTEQSAIGMPIQRLLARAMEKRTYNMLCTDSKTKARLLSAGAKSAYQWLTTLPTEQQLCMADIEVVRALRHRIGIAPIDLSPMCGCGAVVNDHNFDHFHGCELNKNAAARARHDMVQQALACVATHAGVATRMDYGHSSAKEKFGSRLNPDGVLFGLHASGADVVTDVCITNPSCDSRVARLPVAVAKLAAARQEETAKRQKYSDFIVHHRSVFCPFVAESYGAFGKSVEAILWALTRRANQRAPPSAVDLTAFSYAQWSRRVIAIAIQRGNSRLVDVAAQRLKQRAGM